MHYLPCPLYFLKLRRLCLLVGREKVPAPIDVRFLIRCLVGSSFVLIFFDIIPPLIPSMHLMLTSYELYPHAEPLSSPDSLTCLQHVLTML